MTGQEHINRNDGDNRVSVPDETLALIHACIAGERLAQKKLYDKYAPFIYGVIRRYIANKDAAQEILNDTFFKILTRLNQYSFKGAFEGWMRRVVINIITDHFRKEFTKQPTVEINPGSNDPYVESDSVAKLSYKELLQAIHALPDTQRTIFNLFVFENFSHKEISTQLGINENNSRWYLNDARTRLKKMIELLTK